MSETFDLMVDPLPEPIQAAIETHTRLLANQQYDQGQLQAVVETLLRWDPGDTITVAFLGGDAELHAKIRDAANEWTEHANLTFDFETAPGVFRTWSRDDTAYAADIRIGFDRVFQPGYWSIVGRNSVEPNVVSPAQASMNYGGFDVRLPADYAATVLHEFGHALGLHHEHASPNGGCDNEFRFNDDPGYQRTTDAEGRFIEDAQGRRPGIYTVLSGPPNRWPKDKVDRNLRQLPRSSAYEAGPFDVSSIMKYYFADWMFVRGASSVCFSEKNVTLSDGDIVGIKKAYPLSPQEQRERMTHSRDVLTMAAESPLEEDLRGRIRSRLQKFGAIRHDDAGGATR